MSSFFVRFDVRDDTYLWLYQIYEIFRGCEGKMVVVHCRRGCRWDLFGSAYTNCLTFQFILFNCSSIRSSAGLLSYTLCLFACSFSYLFC